MIGGVPCAVIITCLFYGAISGSAPATVAAVGAMTIPVMVNLGYSKEFSTAVVTVAGGLGCIIPPSIPFVLYSTSAAPPWAICSLPASCRACCWAAC